MRPDVVAWLRRRFASIHEGRSATESNERVGDVMLSAFINHFGRAPFSCNRLGSLHAHATIVRRARSTEPFFDKSWALPDFEKVG